MPEVVKSTTCYIRFGLAEGRLGVTANSIEVVGPLSLSIWNPEIGQPPSLLGADQSIVIVLAV